MATSVSVSIGLETADLDPAASLEPSSPRLASGLAVLTVTGHRSRRLRIDGVERRLSTGQTGILALDLAHSTGHHRLEIDGDTYWFSVEDSKLGLEGLAAMLRELRNSGQGWRGQIVHSSGIGYRDPYVLFSWLDQWADTALNAIDSVLRAPMHERATSSKVTRRGGPAVMTPATTRYLRASSRRNLIRHPRGVVKSDSDRYQPARVVARKQTSTVQSIANRRSVALLHLLRGYVHETLTAGLPASGQARCRSWRERAGSLAARPLARSLTPRAAVALRSPRTTEEMIRADYHTIATVAADAIRQFGWAPTQSADLRYSYVQNADLVFQAYAAVSLASALELEPTSGVLGSRDVAFSGHDIDMYYDAPADPEVLRSWRRETDVPDASRVDIVLHHRPSGRVALLDAKYRQSATGHASESSRKDMAAYMNLYGASSSVILFPGGPRHSQVVHNQLARLRIYEVAINPEDSDLHNRLNWIFSSFEDLPY